MKKISLCPFCTSKVEESASVCPHCGNSLVFQNEPHQLAVGTLLKNRYWVGRVIGKGGFGITYIGYDTTLDAPVAIKEYFPFGLANRHHTISPEVTLSKSESDSGFRHGLDNFIKEARVLAKFMGDPNVVNVRDYFEENNTAYIVMEYLSGVSMQQYLEKNGPVPFNELLRVLGPVMDSLDSIHKQGLIHRDISPANLMFMENGSVKLLDFGTVRNVNGTDNHSLSVILKPGYAPAEQYDSHGSQGPWSDVYALGSTIYKMITGVTPENSMNRMLKDTLKTPTELGASITPLQEKVLLSSMALNPAERPQSVRELKEAFINASMTAPVSGSNDERTVVEPNAFGGDDPATFSPSGSQFAPSPIPEAPKKQKAPKRPKPRKSSSKSSKIAKIVGIAAGAILLLLVILFVSSVIKTSKRSMKNYNTVKEEATKSDLDVSDKYGRLSHSILTEEVIDEVIKKGLTSLTLKDCEISTLLLEYLHGDGLLESLTLEDCYGYDSIDPLAGMSSLKYLSIYSTNDTPIPNATKDFDNIVFLSIYTSSPLPEDGALLSCFPSLHGLLVRSAGENRLKLNLNNLRGNNVMNSIDIESFDIVNSDFSHLGLFPSVYDVTLTDLGMEDISWASSLGNISILHISNNKLSSLNGLSSNVGLVTLDATDNALIDISALSICSKLEYCYLSNNKIQDITPLKSAAGMNTLKVDHNQLTNLNGCENMLYLKKLDASYNALTDISGLCNTTQLTSLYLSHNQITDISPIEHNGPKLEILDLDNNDIQDLSPLSDATALLALLAGNNRVETLAPIASSTKLYVLDASQNKIGTEGISCLSSMYNMAYLNLSSNSIDDILVLEGLLNMQYLYLSGNSISNISPIKQMEKLSALDLSENKITDISRLPNADYRFLFLFGNSIDDISVLNTNIACVKKTVSPYISWNEALTPEVVSEYNIVPTYVDVPTINQAPLTTSSKCYICTTEDARKAASDSNGKAIAEQLRY